MAAQTGAGKKSKKSKGRTLNLTEFLQGSGEDPGLGKNVVRAPKEVQSSNWAEEMEEYDTAPVETLILPSAPKASRGPDVDLSQLPTSPPFTAYVSNLPYELNDADIRNFFRDLKISEIRLTRDESGRLKGYGCVDFEDRESLLEALGFQDQNLRGRPIRVSLHTGTGERGGQRGGRDRFGERERDGPDRTSGDWRSVRDRPAMNDRPERGGYRNGPATDNDHGQRDSFNSRGGGYRDRGFADRRRDQDRNLDSEWQHAAPMQPREDRMGGNRGGARRNDYGGGSSYDDRNRDRGRYNDAGGYRNFGYRGEGSQDDRNWSSYTGRGYDRRGGPGGNARRPMGREDDWDRGSDRDRYNSSRPTYSRGNSGERDDHRYGGERNEAPRSGYRPAAHVPREDTVDGTRGEEEAPSTKQEMPKERPRLKLLPRSSGSNSTDPAPAPAEHHASIFGGAKPVDTSAREREIEERLRREAEEKQARLQQERESRDKDRDRDRDHGDRERGPRKDRMQLGAAEREGGYESHEDDDGRPRSGRRDEEIASDRREVEENEPRREWQSSRRSEDYGGEDGGGSTVSVPASASAPSENAWERRRLQRPESAASSNAGDDDDGGGGGRGPRELPRGGGGGRYGERDQHRSYDDGRGGGTGPAGAWRSGAAAGAREGGESYGPPPPRYGGDRGGRGGVGRGGSGAVGRGARRLNSRDGSYQNAARSSTSPVPDGGGGSGKFSRGPVRRGVSDEGQDAGPDDGKREAGGKKNSTVAVAPILAQPRREDVKAEPAPAPAVNVWAVRLESQKSSSPASAISSSSSAPPLSKTSSDKGSPHSSPHKRAPASEDNDTAAQPPGGGRSAPRQQTYAKSAGGSVSGGESIVPAPPPVENAWHRRASMNATATTGAGVAQPGGASTGVVAGKSAGGGGVPRPVLGFGRGVRADAAAPTAPASVGVAAPAKASGPSGGVVQDGGNVSVTPSAPPVGGVPTPSDEVAPPAGVWGRPNNIRRHADSEVARPKGGGGEASGPDP